MWLVVTIHLFVYLIKQYNGNPIALLLFCFAMLTLVPVLFMIFGGLCIVDFYIGIGEVGCTIYLFISAGTVE